MIVGLDVTPLSGPRTGVARYTLELVHALIECAPQIDVRLLSNRLPADAATAMDLAGIRRFRAPGFPSRAVWMQAILPVALASQHVDVCHYTNFDAPMIGRTPAVVTVHDMSLLISPEQHPARRVMTLAPVMRVAARRARAVVCPTESARRETIELLGLDPARVHVAAGCVAPIFRTMTDETAIAATRARYGIGADFLLFVGTIEPRKNLASLARAFARLRADGYDGQLVICGGLGWKSADLRPAIETLGVGAATVFTGFVPDEDVVALLNGTRAFVYPSLYEGFGLPIVEAMACGAPVVTSDRGAMAEVAGGAALLADPTNDESLAGALSELISNDAARLALRQAGLARAANFSRANAARQAVGVYEAALAA